MNSYKEKAKELLREVETRKAKATLAIREYEERFYQKAAGSDEGESDLIKMFYSGKADAYETALSLINVALDGDPDDAE